VPALVDIDISWETTGPFERHGRGDAVAKTDPAAFRGRFAPALSKGRFSGVGAGFSFSARGNSRAGYAEIGSERNGSQL
jgi:hypothetical protein